MAVVHKKEQCPQGHKYTEENSYIDKNGYRHCKTCRTKTMRLRREHNVRVGRGVNNSSKTECPKGHPYDEKNTITYLKPNGKSRRCCRACARANMVTQNVKRYGLTKEKFEALLDSQNSRCAICKGKFWDEVSSPHIDHDHSCCNEQMASCGKCVRGLLCRGCNQMLGCAKDEVNTLSSAIKYLKSGVLTF